MRGWHRSDANGLSYRTTETENFIVKASTYEGDDCLIWPFKKNGYGYAVVRRLGKMRMVSRIVCERAYGPSPTLEHETAHGCGVQSCVNKNHIRWATHAENLADKLLHGTHTRGERHPSARLTQGQVREIRALRGTMSQVKVAAIYGVSAGAVQGIMNRKRWGWLE